MNIIDFAGRFHPLIVHLPIGIISIFLVLLFAISREKLRKSEGIIKLILLVSAITSTLSSITGYLISLNGSYDNDLVLGHQVLGISLTVVGWITYFGIHYLMASRKIVYNGVIVVSLLLMILTGHAGGSLTHGSDFLSPPPVSQWFLSSNAAVQSFSMDSRAIDLATFIFEKKCNSCHGKSKQKGKLRLDTHEGIRNGGQEGEVISQNASSSLLIQRLLLPPDDDDHMPPKERKQLTKQEISFLMWWIDQGADFEASLSQLSFPDSLHALLGSEKPVASNKLVPDGKVKMADAQIIARLQDLGVLVLPISQSSNYLSVNFVNVLAENSDKVVTELGNIKDQLIWLNLDYQDLSTDSWEMIGMLTELRNLRVKESNLNDQHLRKFNGLTKLVHLNLVGTKVTYSGLKSIEKSSLIEVLSLYRTAIVSSDVDSIRSLFPIAHIDTGNYFVPILKSDTTVLTKQ